MQDSIVISVIIPIYNAQSYLGKCLGTLLQTVGIEKTEIILVDDGSSDTSGSIADKYESEYQNIRVIHKANEGPSDARNAGLSEAHGNYIFFCDADDEVVSTNFAKMISLAGSVDTDIVLWNSTLIDENGKEIIKEDGYDYSHVGLNEKDGIISGRNAIAKEIEAREYYVATVWMGMFRRKFLTDNKLYFKSGILHEDELWVPQVLLRAESVKYASDRVYLYRIHKGSITNAADNDYSKHVESLIYVYPELYKLCDEELNGDPIKKKLEKTLTHRYLYSVKRYDFYRYGYGRKIDKKTLWKTAGRKDKCRVLALMAKDLFKG